MREYSRVQLANQAQQADFIEFWGNHPRVFAYPTFLKSLRSPFSLHCYPVVFQVRETGLKRQVAAFFRWTKKPLIALSVVLHSVCNYAKPFGSSFKLHIP